MNFGQALEALKKGQRARRRGWNGKGIFVELQRPDAHSKMSHSYLYIDTTGLETTNPDAPKNRVPWLPSQTDMLAEDWEAVDNTAMLLKNAAFREGERAMFICYNDTLLLSCIVNKAIPHDNQMTYIIEITEQHVPEDYARIMKVMEQTLVKLQ